MVNFRRARVAANNVAPKLPLRHARHARDHGESRLPERDCPGIVAAGRPCRAADVLRAGWKSPPAVRVARPKPASALFVESKGQQIRCNSEADG